MALALDAQQLGKRYVLRRSQGARYVALRDVLAGGARSLARRALGRGEKAASKHEDFWALRGVSLKIEEGESVGLIGRNGAGKSTLLKVLSRITEPSEGRFVLRGRVGSLLEVGTGFHPELTGRENIFLNGAILGMRRSEIARRFDEMVAFAEVERFLETPVKHYSSGMYMRLAFSVAAHLEPEVLLVDEVLAVGDSRFQKKCLGKMGEVARVGRTVVFVSHNMGAIQALCRRAIVLNKGGIVFDGNVSEGINLYSATSEASLGGDLDLTEWRDQRSGPQAFSRLTSIRLTDGDGATATTFFMGAALRVQLGIDFAKPGEDYEIGISVGSLHGVSLHYLLSNWEGLGPVERAGRAVIEMELPSLQLFPGRYLLSVWVKRQGGSYDDGINEVMSFSVEEAHVTAAPAYFTRYTAGTQMHVPSRWRYLPPPTTS